MLECQACGDGGQVWPTTPRVVCCGRPECRARLTWDRERWDGAIRMMESRVRVGERLSALDVHARKIARGKVEVTEVTWPVKEKKLTKKQKAKAVRDARNPKLGV